MVEALKGRHDCSCEQDYTCIYVVDSSNDSYETLCINCLGKTLKRDMQRRVHRLLFPFTGAKDLVGPNVAIVYVEDLNGVLQAIHELWKNNDLDEETIILVVEYEWDDIWAG